MKIRNSLKPLLMIVGILSVNCFSGSSKSYEVTCQEVLEQQGKVQLVDVRTAEEYQSELGHIQGTKLVTLGIELTNFLKTADKSLPIIFICRSGKRSLKAVEESLQLGFRHPLSMKGGMLEWHKQGLPVIQESGN